MGEITDQDESVTDVAPRGSGAGRDRRTTISIPDDLHALLERAAGQLRCGINDLFKKAVCEMMEAEDFAARFPKTDYGDKDVDRMAMGEILVARDERTLREATRDLHAKFLAKNRGRDVWRRGDRAAALEFWNRVLEEAREVMKRDFRGSQEGGGMTPLQVYPSISMALKLEGLEADARLVPSVLGDKMAVRASKDKLFGRVPGRDRKFYVSES